ncbi:hypothetical protein GWK47_052327 [Chionoecetes opilio]|uniref:Uncharacterized protein n=1 Tax=Chionoecetes opilio TaxID=41210 RepID=A0A8J4Y775_CHIOP|nr:hypothetical protein GWK47_052327 [Chionoecetes opilio]
MAQHINPRTGRKARRRTLPSDAPARIKTLLSTSLPHIGPKLFNNLPGKLRNLTECSVQKFKHHLDNHLQTIPDEPPVPGYASVSRADTNSISDQVNLQHRDAGYGCSGGAPRLCTREYPQDGNNFIVRPISLKARIHGAIWSYDHRTDMVGSNQIGSVTKGLFAATNEQGKDPSSLPLGSRWGGVRPTVRVATSFPSIGAPRMGGNRRGDGLAEQETGRSSLFGRGREWPVLGTAWPSGSVGATVGWGHGLQGRRPYVRLTYVVLGERLGECVARGDTQVCRVRRRPCERQYVGIVWRPCTCERQ